MLSLLESKLFTLLFSITLVVVLIPLTHSKILRRYYFSGILYENDENSIHVDFADTKPKDWMNLTALTFKYGLETKGLFCPHGEGAWISYPLENFKHGSRYYELIVGDHCVPAEYIGSIQPIGYIYGFSYSSIAYFKEPYFASEGKYSTNETVSGDYKSLIHMGGPAWTIEGTTKDGPKKFCLLRDHNINLLCVIPDVMSALGFTSSQIKLTKYCEEDVPHHFLQTCYDEGVYRITHEFDLTSEAMNTICKGTKNVAASKFASVMEIWKGRIVGNLENYDTVNIFNNEAHFRVDFLVEMIDIFSSVCPRVSVQYLSLLLNVYLLHLREVWKKYPKSAKMPIGGDWEQAWDFLQQCGVTAAGTHTTFRANCQTGEDDIEQEDSIYEELAMESMLGEDRFDPIIEQIWLIFNLVSPYCSHVDDYTNNLWFDFPNLFKKHFLYPLENQWMNPGVWQTIYPTMFNGFDMDAQHSSIIECVQQSFKMSPLFDPVGRTPGFDKYMWGYQDKLTSSNMSTIWKDVEDAPAPAPDSEANANTPSPTPTGIDPNKENDAVGDAAKDGVDAKRSISGKKKATGRKTKATKGKKTTTRKIKKKTSEKKTTGEVKTDSKPIK